MVTKSKAGSVPAPGMPLAAPQPHPPTVENLRLILFRALEFGCVIPSIHFDGRSPERDFNSLDAEALLETGKIVEGPIYIPTYHSFQFEIQGRIDGKGWRLVAALDCSSDFIKSPRVLLITMHRRRMQRVQRK
jgi:hypothetical protein